MGNFFTKIAAFMQGRYGNDKLNFVLLIITLASYVTMLFFRFFPIVYYILFGITALFFALYLFRAFSKNITRRMYENQKFLSVCTAVKRFFKLQFRKLKEIKTHRYFKCPYCKAQLRVRRRTGTHPVRCPQCRQEFKKTIII